MSIKDKYRVQSTKTEVVKEWFLKKHYAYRIPSISFCFALFNNDGYVVGVCSFGQPPVNFNDSNDICIGIENVKVVELNRLITNDNLEKNVLSFFVSECFKLLPKPMIIVSYSDTRQNHNGYIYQATNWIYTGLPNKTGGKEYFIDGNWMSNKSLADRHGTRSVNDLDKIYKGCDSRDVSLKHRYFYFIGNKKQKKQMTKSLKYETIPYPKGQNKNYDADYKPTTQATLF